MTYVREVTKLTIRSLTLAYIDCFLSLICIRLLGLVDVEVDFEPMSPGFESRKLHDFFFDLFFFYVFFSFLSLLLQCKFANSTLLSLLSFSYFITPHDAQAYSAFSALILSLTMIRGLKR